MPKFSDIEETALKVSRNPGVDGEYPTTEQLQLAKEILDYAFNVLHNVEGVCSLTQRGLFQEIIAIDQMINARKLK